LKALSTAIHRINADNVVFSLIQTAQTQPVNNTFNCFTHGDLTSKYVKQKADKNKSESSNAKHKHDHVEVTTCKLKDKHSEIQDTLKSTTGGFWQSLRV